MLIDLCGYQRKVIKTYPSSLLSSALLRHLLKDRWYKTAYFSLLPLVGTKCN